eukprot:SAG11_NODE_596_length_8299_cov_12.479512_2_plen_203_part_00
MPRATTPMTQFSMVRTRNSRAFLSKSYLNLGCTAINHVVSFGLVSDGGLQPPIRWSSTSPSAASNRRHVMVRPRVTEAGGFAWAKAHSLSASRTRCRPLWCRPPVVPPPCGAAPLWCRPLWCRPPVVPPSVVPPSVVPPSVVPPSVVPPSVVPPSVVPPPCGAALCGASPCGAARRSFCIFCTVLFHLLSAMGSGGPLKPQI